MKKVLVIANLFHSSPRIPGIAAYLPEHNWRVIIVTPPLGKDFAYTYAPPQNFFSNTEIIEVPYRGDILWFWRKILKRIFNTKEKNSLTESIKERVGASKKSSIIDNVLFFYQSVFGYPDTEKYWIRPVLKMLRPLLKKEKIDVILSTSPYPTNHLIAEKIKKEFEIPWVADFRDPWSQNHNYPYGKIRRWFDTRLEKKILAVADAVVAASPEYAEKEGLLLQKKCSVITNGFDGALLNKSQDIFPKKFTLCYTGRIYLGKQNPLHLLRAVKELIDEKKIDAEKISIDFFGETSAWLQEQIHTLNLDSIALLHGTVPREEILRKQRESHILVIFSWEDKKERGVYPKKIFEYFASQRPIFITGGTNDEGIKNIIRETNAGTSATTIHEIKEQLLIFYIEYDKTNTVHFRGDMEKIKKYTYYEMAKKFASIFTEVIEKPKQ